MLRASRVAVLLVLLPAAAPLLPPGLSVIPPAFAEQPCAPQTVGTPTCSERPPALIPLYAGFVTLQGLDVHSSVTVVDRGGRETNPLLAPLVNRPAAFVALKVGATAGTIFVAEKLRRRSRVGAIVFMVALDSAYATIVAHNYRVAHRLR